GTRSSVEDQDITQSSELIYPNPAQDFVNAPSYLGWEYRIFDLIGNCVQRGTVESDKININGLSAGFYTVRFFKDGKQAVEKLVKE
ncbi:MAG TPA: T9SS type A sorting domain-containing protein, partial [Bacteroidota bacterium]|nr:T9SS type A sorting domain-containing protein [Bacteroidota bacterium]